MNIFFENFYADRVFVWGIGRKLNKFKKCLHANLIFSKKNMGSFIFKMIQENTKEVMKKDRASSITRNTIKTYSTTWPIFWNFDFANSWNYLKVPETNNSPIFMKFSEICQIENFRKFQELSVSFRNFRRFS